MDELIYYPGFEIEDADWAKFALLYLGKLHPIIPESADFHSSVSFWRLRHETDLIHPHRPEYAEGERATWDALDQAEKILRHPQRYEPVFKMRDIVQAWKLPANHRGNTRKCSSICTDLASNLATSVSSVSLISSGAI